MYFFNIFGRYCSVFLRWFWYFWFDIIVCFWRGFKFFWLIIWWYCSLLISIQVAQCYKLPQNSIILTEKYLNFWSIWSCTYMVMLKIFWLDIIKILKFLVDFIVYLWGAVEDFLARKFPLPKKNSYISGRFDRVFMAWCWRFFGSILYCTYLFPKMMKNAPAPNAQKVNFPSNCAYKRGHIFDLFAL